MKRFLMCAVALAAFSIVSSAQTPSGTSTDQSSTTPSATHSTTPDTATTPSKSHKHSDVADKSASGKEVTVKGCIEQSGNDFVLKGKRNHNIELISSEDLKPHVGHTVKVTGTWTTEAAEASGAGAMPESDKNSAAASGHKEGKEKHLRVSNVEMVAETCTGTAAGKSDATKQQ